MKTLRNLFLPLFLLASLAPAATLSYNVSVNTSGLTGGQVIVDLLCTGVCRSVEANILNFTPTATLGATGSLFGAPVGDLGTGLLESNNAGGDDFFQAYTFGGTFSFKLILSGAGLDPGPNTFDATTFILSLYNSAGDTALVEPALQIDIAGDGSISNTTTDRRVSASLIPEPQSLLLLASGLALLAARRFRK